jgi:hypothetical protein
MVRATNERSSIAASVRESMFRVPATNLHP